MTMIIGTEEDDVLTSVPTTYGTVTAGDVYGQAGDDVLIGSINRDYLFGEADDDVLIGGFDLDVLFGGDGEDVLKGGKGNDRLEGGLGEDWLKGGADRDVFVVGLDGRPDFVRDFTPGDDRLSVYADSDDTPIYNEETGRVTADDGRTVAWLKPGLQINEEDSFAVI